MSNSEFGLITALLLLLLASAHLLGHLFEKLHQPKVAGEILAGILLGPAVLGRIAPHFSLSLFGAGAHPVSKQEIVLSFLYNLGLLLLMFSSGSETRGLFGREDRREVAWLGLVGTGLPFLAALVIVPQLPLSSMMGPAGQQTSLILVISIAVAVTSIPVISKILHDLGILHTRFARLVLGVAVLEDIVLWAVLAVATALAESASLPARDIFWHVLLTLLYFAAGLTLLPGLLKRLTRAGWNPLARNSPVGYLFSVLLAYTAIAALCDVSLVFAAFLAGFAVVADADRLSEAIHSLTRISFAVFIPVYFAAVGYKLDLSRSFSLSLLGGFLAAACVVKLFSAGLGARLAGFRWLDSANLSIALNARGGPGIVLASVAYDAKIISPAFYTALVLIAVLTSQAAGAWLDFVLRKGWPLLAPQLPDSARQPSTDPEAAA